VLQDILKCIPGN